MSEFYQVTPKVAKALRKAKLTAAEWKIWSYLVEIDPWGDRYEEVDTLSVMSACEVSKPTYYRAIAKFQDEKIFDFQDKGFNVRNLHGVRSLKNEKTVSGMRQTDKISDSQNCENSLKNEKTVSEMRQLSQNCENQSPKVAPSNDSGTPQISSDLSDYSEDRSNDFSNFSNANSEISQVAIAAENPKLDNAQKCDFKPVDESKDIKSPVKAIAPVEVDSARREIEDFVISKRGLEFSNPERRKGYFDKFSVDDWDNWEFQMKPKASPPIPHRDPIAEDPYRVENAIASMVRCRDFEAVEDRLSNVEKTNPSLANQLREKYLGGVA